MTESEMNQQNDVVSNSSHLHGPMTEMSNLLGSPVVAHLDLSNLTKNSRRVSVSKANGYGN